MDNLCCAYCSAPLQPEDGHDMCTPCLGVDHFREALSDHACSNCSVLPRAVRLARLPSVEQPVDWTVSVQQDPLPLGQGAALTKRSAEDVPLASGRRAKRRGPPGLSTRVNQLSTELAQMKALLQSLRADGGRGETSPPEQGGSSHCEDDVILGNWCLRLLKQLWAVCSWMFPYPSLLHLAPSLGVVMPRPPLSFLPQRSTSRSCMLLDLLCRAYDSGARMGRIGNSLSHLMLGLSSSLESVPLDQSTQGLLDASLQAFPLMTRELGRTLSTLVHARRQVWLAQSSLTEPCSRTLRALPVVSGELFVLPRWRPWNVQPRHQEHSSSWWVSIDLPAGLLLLGQLGARSRVPSPLLSLSWDPGAWLLDRDLLGPKGTMVGPRVRAQFGLLSFPRPSGGQGARR
ncbi:hypothetical protein GOODEAATRI_003645 [Goodea atripinnis]|uniref:Uncharacterized protein n=1 Tax=Goodea atripinnis TaxID=208336 RepID=A0ABV0PVI1_9TELE